MPKVLCAVVLELGNLKLFSHPVLEISHSASLRIFQSGDSVRDGRPGFWRRWRRGQFLIIQNAPDNRRRHLVAISGIENLSAFHRMRHVTADAEGMAPID